MRNNQPLETRFSHAPDHERYPEGWKPTESKPVRTIKDGPIWGKPFEFRGFEIRLNEYGNRFIAAPEGYALPKPMRGIFISVVDAQRAILAWLDANNAADPETGKVIEEKLERLTASVVLPLTESERNILQRKGGATNE